MGANYQLREMNMKEHKRAPLLSWLNNKPKRKEKRQKEREIEIEGSQKHN